MTESVFYNLASSEGVAAIARLRELGHAVGLHAVHPNVELDERFDPVVSWHNPSAEYMSRDDPGRDQRLRASRTSTRRRIARTRISTGAPGARTRSCEAAAFRGCRSSSTRRSGSYEGATMGLTMRSMLNAEKARRLEQLGRTTASSLAEAGSASSTAR